MAGPPGPSDSTARTAISGESATTPRARRRTSASTGSLPSQMAQGWLRARASAVAPPSRRTITRSYVQGSVTGSPSTTDTVHRRPSAAAPTPPAPPAAPPATAQPRRPARPRGRRPPPAFRGRSPSRVGVRARTTPPPAGRRRRADRFELGEPQLEALERPPLHRRELG